MILFRLYVISLPQTLLLFLLAAQFDLLGGWNPSQTGFHALLLLFVVTPFFTLSLLIAEFIRYAKTRRQSKNAALFWPVVALLLCLETLCLNLNIFSRIHM